MEYTFIFPSGTKFTATWKDGTLTEKMEPTPESGLVPVMASVSARRDVIEYLALKCMSIAEDIRDGLIPAELMPYIDGLGDFYDRIADEIVPDAVRQLAANSLGAANYRTDASAREHKRNLIVVFDADQAQRGGHQA